MKGTLSSRHGSWKQWPRFPFNIDTVSFDIRPPPSLTHSQKKFYGLCKANKKEAYYICG